MRLLALVSLAAASVSLLAVARAAEGEVTDSSLKIQGIFNAQLPGTERKNSLRLIVHPHLGDLTNREHLRMPLGVRYGLTANWEATFEVESYFSHGLKDTPFFERSGFADLHLGTKYRVGPWPLKNWDTGIGIDYVRPLGSPPADVTDGLTHVSPFFTLARPLVRHPDMRIFWGIGVDLVTAGDLPVTPPKNEFGDDAVNLTGGLVWRLKPYTYTLEGTWSTTTGIGGPRDGNTFSFRPGVVWEVPERFTFHAKGQWLLGLGLRVTHGPDGTDFGASAKVRVNFDFKRLLGHKKGPASK